jgi:hypothetical protein
MAGETPTATNPGLKAQQSKAKIQGKIKSQTSDLRRSGNAVGRGAWVPKA